MDNDEELKDGLKRSMSEPAKKKKTPYQEPTRQELAHQDNEARDFRDEWERKFKRNSG